MNVRLLDEAGEVLAETETRIRPFRETIYGPWQGDDDFGSRPVLGSRWGLVVDLVACAPRPLSIWQVEADGVPLYEPATMPINLPTGGSMSHRLVVREYGL